jgi:hypothetical protein
VSAVTVHYPCRSPAHAGVPRLVCWQGPPDFESGLATKVRFLPGELINTCLDLCSVQTGFEDVIGGRKRSELSNAA